MNLKENIRPYFYLAPAYLCISLIFIYPIITLFRFSFMRIRGPEHTFIGLSNFSYLFHDQIFHMAIRHNLVLLICVPFLVLLSLMFSSLLFDRMLGWKFYRVSIFLPYILAIPVVGIVFSYIFQYNGILNTFLRWIGLEKTAVDWLGKPSLALPTVMFVIIWKELGFGTILFLARLMSINIELIEAATIDGANWWQRLFNINIPQLRTAIEFYVIILTINMLSWMFPYIYVMTTGGPANATMITELYIFQHGFRYQMMGVASACAVLLLVITSIFIILQFRIRGGMAFEKE